MTKDVRLIRCLTAVALCLAILVPTTLTAAATSATGVTQEQPKAKVHAKLLDTKVKVDGKARIQGQLDLLESGARGLELIVVQRLEAGVWIDVLSGSCRPNASFRLNVSFSVAAQYTLRMYYPGTTTVAAASSDSFVLTVLG